VNFSKVPNIYQKMQKMAENKNLVEEAVIQLKNLEEAINENAKEILESTMKQEISELVKESLKEADEEETEDFEEEDFEESEESEEESDEFEMDDEEDSEEEFDEFEMEDEEDFEDEMGQDDEVIDFTQMPDSEETQDLLLTVFKKMKPEDEVEIQKDGEYAHLKDGDDEYLISMNESREEEDDDDDEEFESELEETIYEISMDDETGEMEEQWQALAADMAIAAAPVIADKMFGDDEEELEETIYELHMDDEDDELPSPPKEERPGGMFYERDMDFEYEEEEEDDEYGELPMDDLEEMDYQSEEYTEEMMHETTKPKVGKGGKIGKPKFSYKKTAGGFKEKMKAANPTKGTGKPKFEYKESTGKMKKGEFKEASRTLGSGSKFRKGGLPKPKAHSAFNINIEEHYSLMEEVEMLRTKNEEYRKALNIFRDKLNEVAVFNSNLAYTTRLFTEHTTSKQEKINVLRRFDSVETLKESKNLYKTIKDELSSTTKGKITESIEKVMDNEPVITGSAQNLIESKTYENPQFMRMKDLMTKIIK